ncbi:MAG: 50S ribosomal protein L11 methyltransferase [Gemmatimonadaceae bacterium]
MSWISLRVVPAGNREGVLAALFDAGSAGVEEVGDALVTHFPPGTDGRDVADAVRVASPGSHVELGATPTVDWSEAWKAGVGAHTLGALTVAPPWLADATPSARTIVIDPGMAFGTGEHQTTRCVLRLMQGMVRPGDRVADLGAGSAILAIAAAKLGASRATAIELDADAIGNAEENVARNGESARVAVVEGDAALLLPLVAPVDLVVANIISSVLIAMLPTIAISFPPAVQGRAILSGILVSERAMMLGVVHDGGWSVVGEETEGEWWSVALLRGAGASAT